MPFSLIWTDTFKRTARKFLTKHSDLADAFSLVLHKLEANPQDSELRLHPLSGKHKGKHAVSLVSFDIAPYPNAKEAITARRSFAFR